MSLFPRRLTRAGFAEARLLWLLLGVSGALLLLLKISAEIVEGDTLAFDRAILIWLRSVTGGDDMPSAWLRRFMHDMTTLGDNGLLSMLAILATGFLIAAGKKRLGGLLGIGIILGVIASALLKLAFARARPDVVAHLVDVSTASFPSGHAMNSALVYLTIGVLLARGQPLRAARIYILATAVTITLLIGLSRLYLGVHWPTDVLVGWIFGAGWAAMIASAAGRLQTRGAIEQA